MGKIGVSVRVGRGEERGMARGEAIFQDEEDRGFFLKCLVKCGKLLGYEHPNKETACRKDRLPRHERTKGSDSAGSGILKEGQSSPTSD
jgi:hypothetical protein